jgi:hypothetical protein
VLLYVEVDDVQEGKGATVLYSRAFSKPMEGATMWATPTWIRGSYHGDTKWRHCRSHVLGEKYDFPKWVYSFEIGAALFEKLRLISLDNHEASLFVKLPRKKNGKEMPK